MSSAPLGLPNIRYQQTQSRMPKKHPEIPLVIDFHAHMLDEELLEICINRNAITGFGRRKENRSPQQRRFLQPELQIADMDERGIDMHVTFTGPVNMSTWWADPPTALKLTQRMNDIIAGWVQRWPNRFVGTVTLPTQDVALSVGELKRAVNELGHKAVMLPTNVDGDYLGDRKFWPLWEAIRELDVPVFIHPEGIRDPSYHKFALWNSIGQQIEEARVAASMIYEGLLDAVPGLKIVIAHGGGYFATCMGRLDRNIEKAEACVNIGKRKPSEYLRHFYYDTCVYDPLALEMLFKRVGSDRILLGADYPVGSTDPVGEVKEAVTLPPEELNMVAGGTAAKLLGITRAH
jgi:aminocarboxymuconate-semialdehyde decarboxylase